MKKRIFILLGVLLCTFGAMLGLTACGKENEDIHEHKFGEWVTVKAATCTEGGIQERGCACGYSYTENTPSAHTWAIEEGTPPTCSSVGYTDSKYCTKCSAVIKEHKEIAKLPHTEVVDHATIGTCSKKGLSEGKHCSVCGEVTVPQVETDYVHQPIVNYGYEPTCNQLGRTDGMSCAQCQQELKASDWIDAKGHTFQSGYCTVCNQIEPKGEYECDGSRLFLSDKNTEENLILPDVYDGHPIYYVEGRGFKGNTLIRSVVIPEGITNVYGAFEDCTNLESVTISDTVTIISNASFSGCTNLKNVRLPSGLTELSSGLFKDCSNLETVAIPHTVTVICAQAFSGCTSLSSISLPPTITEIGMSAFCHCESLFDFTIPDEVTEIEHSMLLDCNSMKVVIIGKGVTTIQPWAFWFENDDITFFYRGTMAEWEQVIKSSHWINTKDNYTGTIHCTDGILDLDGNQIETL